MSSGHSQLRRTRTEKLTAESHSRISPVRVLGSILVLKTRCLCGWPDKDPNGRLHSEEKDDRGTIMHFEKVRMDPAPDAVDHRALE